MSIQLSPYFKRKIVTKLLRQHVFPISLEVNVCTKSKTHYDTLKVSPYATHNEIKSAYYKLTVQYHPDKNKSESAKQIFQEISEAYEVLSNYKLRKQYDRTVAVKYGSVNQVQRPTTVYQDSYTQKDKIYDFDEWTRVHYENAFKRSLKRKVLYKEFIEKEKEFTKNGLISLQPLKVAFIISTLLFAVIYLLDKRKENDVPSDKKT